MKKNKMHTFRYFFYVNNDDESMKIACMCVVWMLFTLLNSVKSIACSLFNSTVALYWYICLFILFFCWSHKLCYNVLITTASFHYLDRIVTHIIVHIYWLSTSMCAFVWLTKVSEIVTNIFTFVFSPFNFCDFL